MVFVVIWHGIAVSSSIAIHPVLLLSSSLLCRTLWPENSIDPKHQNRMRFKAEECRNSGAISNDDNAEARRLCPFGRVRITLFTLSKGEEGRTA